MPMRDAGRAAQTTRPVTIVIVTVTVPKTRSLERRVLPRGENDVCNSDREPRDRPDLPARQRHGSATAARSEAPVRSPFAMNACAALDSSAFPKSDARTARDQHHRRRICGRAQNLCQLEARDIREHDVQEHDVRLEVTDSVERRRTVVRLAEDDKSLVLEQPAGEATKRRMVVDDQDTRRHVRIVTGVTRSRSHGYP